MERGEPRKVNLHYYIDVYSSFWWFPIIASTIRWHYHCVKKYFTKRDVLDLVIASVVVHVDGLDILQHTDGKFPWHPSGLIEQRLLCSTSNLLATHKAMPGHLRTVEPTSGLILAERKCGHWEHRQFSPIPLKNKQKHGNISLLEACNWLAFQLGICLWERVPFKVDIRVHSTSQCLRLLLVCQQQI